MTGRFSLILLFFFQSCHSFKSNYKKGLLNFSPPPGCIVLDSNNFMDFSEISNGSWMEYVWYQERIFGSSSPEYNDILPDTTVWFDTLSWYPDLGNEYLRSPIFRKKPVVGLTVHQIQKFSEWRSDRVFERILLSAGYLDQFFCENDCFTLEKMLKNQIQFKRRPPPVLYYPKYRVPNLSDYSKALLVKKRTSNGIICQSYLDTFSYIHRFLEPKKNTETNKKYAIINKEFREKLLPMLQSNYVEILNDGQTIPRKWFDNNWQDIDTNQINKSISKLKGFRNACEWVKINVPQHK